MRHLVHLHANGLPARFGTMAELGPGDSLGVGLAALLTSVDRYVGLDRTPYAETERNLTIFDTLVDLLRDRVEIPDEHAFPRVFPRLRSYAFPRHILTDARLDEMLDPTRVAAIRTALHAPSTRSRPRDLISYLAPWTPDALPADSVDLILSHTVLQLAEDLPGIYRTMDTWLRPGGVMSHEIDFKSIGRTTAWNGHWACSDLTWALVQGKRRNHINRLPVSVHRGIHRDLGHDLAGDVADTRPSGISRADLAPRFTGLTDTDLTTASVLLQSRKPPRPRLGSDRVGARSPAQ